MKAALYLRVSTKPRNAKPGQKVHYDPPREQTVENQRLKLREYAKAMDWDIVAEFEDQESGAKSDRAGFTKLMDAATRHEFDVVLVWSLDRFSREGIGKTCDHLRKLAGYKVGFRSYSEPFLDTTSDFAELVTAIFAFFAAFERKRIIERTNAGIARARAKGVHCGRPRLVYRKDKVLELVAAGASYRDVAAKLGLSLGTVQRCVAAK
jgi:DNA invertase Pin-like site-specific DNA recombinase